jgi:hypothetical protein
VRKVTLYGVKRTAFGNKTTQTVAPRGKVSQTARVNK